MTRTEIKKSIPIENPEQRNAFLLYFNFGKDRSIQRVYEELAENGRKRSLVSVKKWSSKFKWIDRVAAMDLEVSDKAEELAIKKASMKKSEILDACKQTMLKYVEQLAEGNIVPTPSDFKKMWEVARVEMGKSIGQEALQGPTLNIFLTKNEKITKVVSQSQELLRKALEGEIEEAKIEEDDN